MKLQDLIDAFPTALNLIREEGLSQVKASVSELRSFGDAVLSAQANKIEHWAEEVAAGIMTPSEFLQLMAQQKTVLEALTLQEAEQQRQEIAQKASQVGLAAFKILVGALTA